MENLKLEHLSPYLPFGLYMIINTPFGNEKRKLELDCGHDFWLHLMQCNVKPILRPLSDLTKEIEIDGGKFVPQKKLSHLDLEWLINSESLIMKTNYEDVLKLLSWHFDIFGLIDKGLAININTLSNE